MATIALHPRQPQPSTPQPPANPLPQLLQTPSGLALVELQGTINVPEITADQSPETQSPIPIGRLIFPDYHPDAAGTAWMQHVYMYVGENQRLTGEVKALPRPVAIVRRRGPQPAGEMDVDDDDEDGRAEELEVVELIKYKVVFSTRPEPVTGG